MPAHRDKERYSSLEKVEEDFLGMIELVPDCRTLCEIHSSQGATGVFKDDILNNWLIKNNPSEFQYKAVCL